MIGKINLTGRAQFRPAAHRRQIGHMVFEHTTRKEFGDTMKLKKTLFAFGFLILAMALPLHAQAGCDDSPENPTVVLALVGGAGALLSAVRSRLRARRNSSRR